MKTVYFPKCSLALLAASLVGFSASAALVQNPSFESDWNPTWPHYAPPAVDGWSGAKGTLELPGEGKVEREVVIQR